MARFSKTRAPGLPPLPDNYFTLKAQGFWRNTASGSGRACARGTRCRTCPEPLIAAGLDNTWHDTAEAVIDNWVGKVYQLTNNDRKLPFQPGVDPADPLGLGKK